MESVSDGVENMGLAESSPDSDETSKELASRLVNSTAYP